jgi:hypothetical protein
MIITAMKKKMQFTQKKTGRPVERSGDQLIALPLALCDSDGHPHKGQKSHATHFLESRYKDADPEVFVSTIIYTLEARVL